MVNQRNKKRQQVRLSLLQPSPFSLVLFSPRERRERARALQVLTLRLLLPFAFVEIYRTRASNPP
jgi:hypothetical protein